MAIPGSRPNNRFILIIGIVCAAIAFVGVLYLLKNSGSGPTRSVLVFKADLAAGTSITADNLTSVDLPETALPANAISDTSQVIGKQVVNNVQANTPVVPALLVAPGQGVAGTAAGGRLDITAGYVAVSIPSSVAFPPPVQNYPWQLNGGGGDLYAVDFYIQPEDHIDILIASQPASGPEIRYSFQDVRVLKAGTSGTAAGAAPASFVVELPRAQAELLTQLVVVGCNTSVQGTSACKSPVTAKLALRPRCEYGDRNYTSDVKSITGKSVDEMSKLSDAQRAPLLAQLAKACVNPYPNYEPLTGAGLPAPGGSQPAQPTLPADGGVTPQTLQGLFQIP